MGFVNGEQFRIQIFEDGSGEYLFDAPVNDILAAGSQDAILANPGNAVGPFILPSPLPIIAPGMLTIQITNVNTPLNDGTPDTTDTTVAYVALVFAIPRRCKNIPPYGTGVDQGVKGIIDR
jgi:hypothetical protein